MNALNIEQLNQAISQFPWLVEPWAQWQTRLENNEIANAILYQAADGANIEVLVHQLSRAIMCANDKQQACGLCHSCDLSLVGNHPDIHWLMPEQAGKSINVDQVRLINKIAMESSQLGGQRIIIISPAEALNESAANALLKTLETPPAHCIFILLTHAVDQLLPTIVSRCQQWHLTNLDQRVITAWLQTQLASFSKNGFSNDASKNDAYTLSLLMHGDAPAKALAFIQEQKSQQFEALIECVLHSATSEIPPIKLIQTEFKQDAIEKIDALLVLLSELQKAHFKLVDIDRFRLNDLVDAVDYETAHQQYKSLMTLRQQLIQSTGLNTELLILDWFLMFNS